VRSENDVHIVQLMPLPTHHLSASLKSRMVLPFWRRLTQIVLEKKAVKWMLMLLSGFVQTLESPGKSWN